MHAIQTIQTIAKDVAHLTVFQRSPNWAAPLNNSVITEDEQKQIKQDFLKKFLSNVEKRLHVLFTTQIPGARPI